MKRSQENSGYSKSIAPHLALAASQFCFGSFHVVAKATIASVDPLALAGFRILGSALIYALVVAAKEGSRNLVPARDQVIPLISMATLGIVANQVLFILGLAASGASRAAMVQPSIPVFSAGLAMAVGLEKPSAKLISGVLLAFLGAAVMLIKHQPSGTLGLDIGMLFLVGNCLAFSTYLVIQKKFLRERDPLSTIALCYILAAPEALLVCGPQLVSTRWTSLGLLPWAGVAYSLVIPSIVGYGLNTWALSRTRPSVVASYTALQPLVSSVLAAIFLGEHLTVRHVVGGTMVVASLALVASASSESVKHKKQKEILGP